MAFSEVLIIKPRLDESTAKQMETSLSARFSRIAGRFGSGLKAVVKGSILGISLGLLNKILNPIEALDEKIKGLLGHGTDIKDLSERFGTDPGKLKQFQDIAQSFGIAPDHFKEVMTKFAESVEKARDEISNPFAEKSASTVIVGQFAKEKDIAEGFKNFLAFLRTTGAGPGTDQPLTAHAQRVIADASSNNRSLTKDEIRDLLSSGELRHRTGAETQAEFEKQVLGAQQFGGVRKLIGSNFDERAKQIKEPSIQELSKTIDKLSGLDAQKQILDVQSQTRDFIEATKKINTDMITAMAAAEARQASETTQRLDSYNNLKKGADAVADLTVGFSKLLDGVSVGLGYMKTITSFIPKIEGSSMFKGIFKAFSKGD